MPNSMNGTKIFAKDKDIKVAPIPYLELAAWEQDCQALIGSASCPSTLFILSVLMGLVGYR